MAIEARRLDNLVKLLRILVLVALVGALGVQVLDGLLGEGVDEFAEASIECLVLELELMR